MQAHDILHFWFTELTPKQRFAKEAALDEAINTRFSDTLEAAARCELFAWRTNAEGRLAEILALDQFSRNVYRDTPRAFLQDALALVLAQELVASGQDQILPQRPARVYLHAPHAQRVRAAASPGRCAVSQTGLEDNLSFELRHKTIIYRFGRYPHHNAILWRSSSAEELAFLSEPGSSFQAVCPTITTVCVAN